MHMAAHLLFVVGFGLVAMIMGHGHIEPLPSDPSWCVHGTILEIGECLCAREKEDSCVGSKCFRQMGLSWYKPSCKDCKCKPEGTKASPTAPKPSKEASGGGAPGQCGGPAAASSGCGGGDGEQMPDWFGKDEKKKPSASDKAKKVPRKIPQKQPKQQKQQPKQERGSYHQEVNGGDAELYRMLQEQQSPLEAERQRRHMIVGVVSFCFAAFFAFLFWNFQGSRAKRNSTKAAESKKGDAKKAPEAKTNADVSDGDPSKTESKTTADDATSKADDATSKGKDATSKAGDTTSKADDTTGKDKTD